MLAFCAWFDTEEFVEGQDAWFAAFPAWRKSMLVEVIMGSIVIVFLLLCK